MAKPIWKGSILDTYNKNDKFGGRENDDVKGLDKAKGVDFLQQLYKGVESVDGFTTNLDAFNHSPTNFNMVNTTSRLVKDPFGGLNLNVGFKWDNVDGISPYNYKEGKNYSKKVQRI